MKDVLQIQKRKTTKNIYREKEKGNSLENRKSTKENCYVVCTGKLKSNNNRKII